MKLLPLVLLVCLALFGCGGDDEPSAPAATNTPAASATEAPAEDAGGDAGGEAEVREMFEDYTQALADRDWDEACDNLAPETTEKLKANITQLGVTNPPSDCEGLMNQLYDTIDKDPAAKKTIDDITGSAQVDKVTITGDSASVSWSATVNGQKTPVTQSARIIDGEWKLIDVN
ncbi:hypothetical protein OJ997_09645 [Solirubrobacter phytolaccae]|uniref:DUF4878 domain-containing protein n=1 Tax=Solirubrobacter phytolaccae TaxID=1404360 RepID=A0A9X3N6U7_9ACTN|nr:hypothetical protein [Solirubrobacter phytolaccae]MDA0180556.1 hypothetical protein [Solirubrobacter phytolaccae]